MTKKDDTKPNEMHWETQPCGWCLGTRVEFNVVTKEIQTCSFCNGSGTKQVLVARY